MSSSPLHTAQYATNYSFSTPPLKLTVVALSVLDSALKVNSKFLDTVFIKPLQSARSTQCLLEIDLAKLAKTCTFSSTICQSWMTLEDATLLYKSILNEVKFIK